MPPIAPAKLQNKPTIVRLRCGDDVDGWRAEVNLQRLRGILEAWPGGEQLVRDLRNIGLGRWNEVSEENVVKLRQMGYLRKDDSQPSADVAKLLMSSYHEGENGVQLLEPYDFKVTGMKEKVEQLRQRMEEKLNALLGGEIG